MSDKQLRVRTWNDRGQEHHDLTLAAAKAKRIVVETNCDVAVDLWYPNIDPESGPLQRVAVRLQHVRAADDLLIEFDGERDGYVIRMDRTRTANGYMDVVEEKVEVAFIPSWLEVPPQDHPPDQP